MTDEEGFGGSHMAIYDATFSLIRALNKMCDGKSTKKAQTKTVSNNMRDIRSWLMLLTLQQQQQQQ
jgi:hypothetical protein